LLIAGVLRAAIHVKYRRARFVEISIAFRAGLCYICASRKRASKKGVVMTVQFIGSTREASSG